MLLRFSKDAISPCQRTSPLDLQKVAIREHEIREFLFSGLVCLPQFCEPTLLFCCAHFEVISKMVQQN